MKQISFLVDEKDHKAIKVAAAQRNMSIRHFIMTYLKRALEQERISNEKTKYI